VSTADGMPAAKFRRSICLGTTVLTLLGMLSAGSDCEAGPTVDEIAQATLAPYKGPRAKGVDVSTLTGKVVCGYQGWFRCEGDGAGVGWHHYGPANFGPGRCSIDLWPEMSELGADERFATPFRFADGRPAEVFSSVRLPTVERHFQWMQQYGIDGALVQRFAVSTHDTRHLGSLNQVLTNCRQAANRAGRTWAVMYDLSGLTPDRVDHVIDDWRRLVKLGGISRDPGDTAYLHHRGKPLVALWGLGFKDRAPMLDQWTRLLDFFQHDAQCGGCTVMVGVPTFWRTLERDSIPDPQLHAVIAQADVVSPWTIGRYGKVKDAERYATQTLAGDMAWCNERRINCLPVVFPGFSWHNLQLGRGKESKLDSIPRLDGRFLWSQCTADRRAGASMLYIAMFDELDEGTAIFKCARQPPVGQSPFLGYGDVPSDHYLWLAGQAARLLRGELEPSPELPARSAGP
jgi:hypothetical protein